MRYHVEPATVKQARTELGEKLVATLKGNEQCCAGSDKATILAHIFLLAWRHTKSYEGFPSNFYACALPRL
jgi:hypothetical protein